MTNHNPSISSSNATGSFSENTNTTGSNALHNLSGTMNFTDSDHSDTHTVSATLKTKTLSSGSVIPATTLAHLNTAMSSSILTDSSGSGKLKWAFSAEDDDFDFLSKNQTLTLTYEVKLKDNHGGSTTKLVTIKVTGTDDKPIIDFGTEAMVSEQANKSLSLSPDAVNIAVHFTDVDLTNTGHTATVIDVSASGATGGILPGALGEAELMSFFDITSVVKASGSSNGTINTRFSAPDLAFDYLAAGETIDITYTIRLNDNAGLTSDQTVVVTVVGSNDKPVVLAFPESAHLKEDQNLSGGNLTAQGDFHFSDLDLSDTHTVSTSVTATRSGGGTVPISNADLIDALGATIDPDSTSQFLGEVDWNFALPNSAVDFLAEGETLTLKYQITVTDPSGASDTQEVCITVLGINKPVVTKTATVPGGTANAAGEVISYDIAVANAGVSTLTGITVTDPSVSNLAPVVSGGFNSGDTNHDNQLNAGETWHYTASYTVTQNDLNTNGGGDGIIENTVTVDTAETLPVSATASVEVENGASLEMVKTADVSSVDAAGDVINYTINVTNTGMTTLTGLEVHDPQFAVLTPVLGDPVLGTQPLLSGVLNGDYNAGDTNENGIEDPGETFQYAAVGDEDQNGIQDNGEVWVFANVGDTNQNGFADPGETFQFYNAGDTDHDGEEDPGETFQFNVNDQVAGVDADHNGFNDGDLDNDGNFDVGETWQFAGTYTVTQDDIDNGGVVDLALTHDNTATVTTFETITGSASASVDIEQNPHVVLSKSASVPGGTADAADEVISYTITVTNDGNMTLTDPVVSDPSVSNLAAVLSGGFNAGDADQDGKLDLGETWQYTANHTVTQAEMDAGGTIDNTASVTTDQGATSDDSASITVEQNPSVTLAKDATVPGGTADTAGEVISYTIAVTNNGNVSLTSVAVNDPSVSDLAAVMSGTFNVGDLNADGSLSVGETFQYTASHTVTQADLDTNGGGDGTIDNTASVTTAQGASANDSASVTVVAPPPPTFTMTVEKEAFGYFDNNNNDVADTGDTIVYHFAVHNTGTGTLTDVQVTDVDANVSVTGGILASLAAGASDTTTWAGTYNIQSLDVTAGYHDNDAVANSGQTNAVTGTVHTVLADLFELMP